MNTKNDDKDAPDMNARIRRTLAERQRGIMAAHGRLAAALGLTLKPDEEDNDE
ncbi:hypothetical protein BH20ACT24_BH20ACT24_07160 [soil metagenome]